MTAVKKWTLVGNIFVTLVTLLLVTKLILGEKVSAVLDLIVAILCVPGGIAYLVAVFIDPVTSRIFLFLVVLSIGILSIIGFFGA